MSDEGILPSDPSRSSALTYGDLAPRIFDWLLRRNASKMLDEAAAREHMALHATPDVFWLGDPEFDKAFRELTGDTSMTEAAFTKPTTARGYPGFVNAQLSLDGAAMILTVRSDPPPIVLGDDDSTGPGETAQVQIELADWDEFIAQASRVRAAASAATAVTDLAGDGD